MTMRRPIIAPLRLVVVLLAAVTGTAVSSSSSSSSSSWCRAMNGSPSCGWGQLARRVRGGGAAGGDYTGQLETIKSSVMTKAADAVEDLRTKVVSEGKIIENYGDKADTICNQVMQDFASQVAALSSAGDEDEDPTKAVLYDRKVQELEEAVDSPLHVLYLKQLQYIREQALQQYRASMKTGGSSTMYDAMLQADSQFVREAEQATRDGSDDWDYTKERSFLQTIMNYMSESSTKVQEIQASTQQQQQTAMQFLQSQQQMIQQLQMQLYGQSSPWNVGVAYRIPDTNFNLQGSYQQGRSNIQLSCAPDEYAPMLGPNGFTQGVGPGNLGLSLNLSL